MRRLEQEAKERAERTAAGARRGRGATPSRRQAGPRPAPEPISEEPEDKAQTNFTDPESKIMKVSNKGFDYCFNAQVVVDEAHQIILAAEVSAAANDKQQGVPMGAAALANLEAAEIERPREERPTGAVSRPIPLSGDNGYFSEEQVKGLESQGFDPHIATGRQKHHRPVVAEAVAPPAAGATIEERMAYKLRTEEGRACYAKRKQIVEPVFGQVKQARGFRQFLVRGLKKVEGEWKLVCLTHNLLKIWRYQCAPT